MCVVSSVAFRPFETPSEILNDGITLVENLWRNPSNFFPWPPIVSDTVSRYLSAVEYMNTHTSYLILRFRHIVVPTQS